ncbi:MAG: HlyC/CorC family transporter [Bacteroidales bacterium]|nr:HlyC/CorC family transporter [Bacteroidales bacterium]
MEILIIILLILFNGFLALSEVALLSSKQIKMQTMVKEKKRGAKLALSLLESPDKYLSTIQVGITLIGILTGVYSGDTIAASLKSYIAQYAPMSIYAGAIAKTVVVVAVTYFTIVLGELIPKKIALTFPEGFLRSVAGFLKFFSVLFAPCVWILVKSIDLVAKLLKIQPSADAKITEEEILAAVEMGTKEGEVQDVEQDIVERVFDLGDRDVDSVMTHRGDLTCIDIHAEKEDIKTLINEKIHTYYPVIDGNIDNLLGVISLNDLLDCIFRDIWDLRSKIESPVYMPENTSAYNALEQFKRTKIYYALITDEFGCVQGMITSADMMEALVGHMTEPDEDDETIIQHSDNTWIVDGQYSFYDFLSYFDMEDEFQEYDYNTLSGLILDILERLPQEGEKVEWRDFQFTISKMDGARIDKMLVNKIQPQPDNSEEN